MQHLQAMECQQAVGDLLDDAAHGFEQGFGWSIIHCVQRLALDVLGHRVEDSCASCPRAGLEHVRIADALRDPVFHEEAVEMRGSARNSVASVLMTTGVCGLHVGGQVHMAAAAGVQLAHDRESVESHARRRAAAAKAAPELPVQLPGVLLRQAIDAHDLDGEIVRGCRARTLRRRWPRRGIQIAGVILDRIDHERGIDKLVDAVGGEHEDVALLERRPGSRSRDAR